MRRKPCFVVACAFAAVGCAPTSEAPSVSFGSSEPAGSWEVTQDAGSGDASVESPSIDRPTGIVAPSLSSGAGRAAPPTSNAADGGTAESTPASVDAGAPPAADSGDTAGPAATSLTSLQLDVTTSPAGGRYQPKNIGAIWIEDDNGDVVKTLQVWAGSRRRYLTGYLGAIAGATIDVTASATLSRHQTHTLTWNLKGKNGATVPPGTYHVRMELTDGNQTGKSNTVDIDTTQGPKTLSPSDAPSFGGIKLVLQ